MYKRHYAFALLVLVAGLPGRVHAQPIVTSASLSSPTTLVVNGSNFGSHGSYGGSAAFLNAAWQNFETGQLAGGNMFLENKATYQWSAESTGARANSRFYARKVFVDNEGGEIGLNQAGTTGKWFISFWMQVDTVADQQSGKFFRIWGDNADVYLSTGAGDLNIRGYSECSSCSPAPTTVWGSASQFVPNTWQRVDIEMSQSPDWVAVYLDGRLQWRRSSTLSGSEQQKWIPSPMGGNGHTLGLGGMLDAPYRGWPTNGFWKFDDIYVDYTYARVELGNASTWAACTRKEIQIPRQWSASQITIDVNQGSFSAGTQAYLYVVDANGSVNATGYPIKIGSSSTTLAVPAAPTNVLVRP